MKNTGIKEKIWEAPEKEPTQKEVLSAFNALKKDLKAVGKKSKKRYIIVAREFYKRGNDFVLEVHYRKAIKKSEKDYC